MKLLVKITLLSILLTLCASACKKEEPEITKITSPEELTAALEQIYQRNNVPGFTISVVSQQEEMYSNSFGYADINNGIEYTNQTIQPIGSISKTFIAAAIVSAIEQGYFTLETDINNILPFEVHNPYYPNEIITVKHLVTHTSGLIDNLEKYIQAYHILPGEDIATAGGEIFVNGFNLEQRQTIPLGDFLQEYYTVNGGNYSKANFANTAPGTSWMYSNIGASLAAYLVEVASGVPFNNYVKSNILSPLGMNNTSYERADLNLNDAAKLYWDVNTPLPKYYNDSYPDGSLITSNEDLTLYLKDMMKGARGQSTTLFSKTGYDMLFGSLLLNGTTPADIGESQGLFWFLKEGKIQHSGSDPGTTCNLVFDASGKSGYLLLTNMDALTDVHEMEWSNLNTQIDHAITSFIENKQSK